MKSLLRSVSRLGVVSITVGLANAAAMSSSSAAMAERSGKEVVDQVCSSCHERGVKNAPKIGDKKAWAPRAAQGLTTLTTNAINGIRNMPAHGGSGSVSDSEIARAITYMVNQSGGHWIEPLAQSKPALARSGEDIVQQQCSKCHRDGLNGAPTIGDRAAWIPRMAQGLDVLVKSAVHGHGAMPARGGLADLSDREIEGAIVYMFNYGVVPVPSAPRAVAPANDPFHKVIDGADVYLGVVKAEGMPASQRPAAIASGKGYYHVNISLIDSNSKVPIKDAHVRVRVADAMSGETKTLEPTSVNDMISYGGYFRMDGNNSSYTITAEVERPGVPGVGEAKFAYKAW